MTTSTAISCFVVFIIISDIKCLNLFNMPPLPGMSDVPGLPGMPDLPGMPGLPGLPIPISPSGMGENIAEAIQICKTQVVLPPEEVLSALVQDSPRSSDGECFLTCVKKELGIIGPDNRYSIEKIKEISEPLQSTNGDLYEKIITIHEECIDAGADVENYCEKGKLMRECVTTKRLAMSI